MALINSGKEFDKDAFYEQMTKQRENRNSTAYTLRIPKGLYVKVKIRLAKEEKTLRDVFMAYLEEYAKE